jgi:epsilon-lactone hydrolase
MDGGEIDAVRALLSSKPRPVGWVQRRERLDEVGSIWPVADDVSLGSVDLDGVRGEWSIAPGSGATRVLLTSGSLDERPRIERSTALRTRTPVITP